MKPSISNLVVNGVVGVTVYEMFFLAIEST